MIKLLKRGDYMQIYVTKVDGTEFHGYVYSDSVPMNLLNEIGHTLNADFADELPVTGCFHVHFDADDVFVDKIHSVMLSNTTLTKHVGLNSQEHYNHIVLGSEILDTGDIYGWKVEEYYE